jgi:hypothetical protein
VAADTPHKIEFLRDPGKLMEIPKMDPFGRIAQKFMAQGDFGKFLIKT